MNGFWLGWWEQINKKDKEGAIHEKGEKKSMMFCKPKKERFKEVGNISQMLVGPRRWGLGITAFDNMKAIGILDRNSFSVTANGKPNWRGLGREWE